MLRHHQAEWEAGGERGVLRPVDRAQHHPCGRGQVVDRRRRIRKPVNIQHGGGDDEDVEVKPDLFQK